MPTPQEIVEDQAMKLSPEERADLADKLWMSVHSREEVDAAWSAEIERRIEQIDSGAVTCLPFSAACINARVIGESPLVR